METPYYDDENKKLGLMNLQLREHINDANNNGFIFLTHWMYV